MNRSQCYACFLLPKCPSVVQIRDSGPAVQNSPCPPIAGSPDASVPVPSSVAFLPSRPLMIHASRQTVAAAVDSCSVYNDIQPLPYGLRATTHASPLHCFWRAQAAQDSPNTFKQHSISLHFTVQLSLDVSSFANDFLTYSTALLQSPSLLYTTTILPPRTSDLIFLACSVSHFSY